MILGALNDYYQRLLEDADSGVARPGYSQEKIGFAIVLSVEGEVVEVIDLREDSGKKKIPALLSVPRPEKRTAGVKPNFLWDKTSYVLGVSASSKRSEQEHAAFKALHQEALAGNDDPGLEALRAFLQKWRPAQFDGHPRFAPFGEELLDANLVFRLRDDEKSSEGLRWLHQRPAALRLWADRQSGTADGASALCLVTGEQAPLARLHPAIRGVNGAQSSGASIVSFNLDAFNSYGKRQGENAPVSEPAAFAYTTALNHLLRRVASNRQRVQIGDTTVVFWAQAPNAGAASEAEDLLAGFFNPGDEDAQATTRLREALEQVRRALPLRDLGGRLDDGTRIHVLGLAPNASRLSIRFWETVSLARFARRLADHFDDIALAPLPWRHLPTPQTLALATAPLYEGKKPSAEDVSPLLAGELTRAILNGRRYPQSLLAALVMRFRADGKITRTRVALCKAVLVRNARLKNPHDKQREVLVSLDQDCSDAGYLLGRLFSTLENIQRAALGAQLNATIRDRYYGAASATPASIFPVLLRNAQNHFSKLRKQKPGLAVVLEKEIGQVMNALPTRFPRSLSIEQQGRFAIGYYHQNQARFAGHGDEAANTEIDTESEGETA
ncbi:type I-C CRISPR-associated protein Cas8c/Csd1 [Lysobacter pythonis]|uniref:Type I-C CRISPR-associated protein Cas8c/Csd1 n=1 Tax=Solilutibacter pythonis TaxID=2483112 RepID=A0A3M2HL37_9GAMM|nr:type I-C CRISPR-associated protein Cas8c/Csd1 [Lysobacter pythonis]RMH89065.1 type I-C CRISPR-associated protein Cas8c/Csd1 [Lysobacter pythonis]